MLVRPKGICKFGLSNKGFAREKDGFRTTSNKPECEETRVSGEMAFVS